MTKGESSDVDNHEVIESAMQGADGNEDASGLNPDPAVREEKLQEVQENLAELSGEQK
ncbi:hypothetical protein [Deinococcus gobiensis]|uniref:hypothetical protein n=1 Tax=Deinococcus gobiensis TaxID=502394 RepID=UPI0002EC56BF|nr:hypothetical protein [Deinococcus gobiensis]